MREEYGDLWADFSIRPDAVVCITTNGHVKANGECVMGRGCAREARDRYPGLARQLGQAIRDSGNHVRRLRPDLVAFPTKHVWWEKSDLELIRQSTVELNAMANESQEREFYLPRPGCSNGQLDWEDVRKVLEEVGLAGNIVVVDRRRG